MTEGCLKNVEKKTNSKREKKHRQQQQQTQNKKKTVVVCLCVCVGSEHRPGFDWHNFATDWHIFLHINGPINIMVPDWWIIGTIDDIDLHFDRTR